jgi:hypothetical protein
MNILGFFNGLFTAFSAARAGKKADVKRNKNKSLEPTYTEQNKKLNQANIQSQNAEIKKARDKQAKSKPNEKEIL